MSERWGACRSCNGQGFRLVEDDPKDGSELAQATDGKYYFKQECGLCGGTGHSGDIQDYKG